MHFGVIGVVLALGPCVRVELDGLTVFDIIKGKGCSTPGVVLVPSRSASSQGQSQRASAVVIVELSET